MSVQERKKVCHIPSSSDTIQISIKIFHSSIVFSLLWIPALFSISFYFLFIFFLFIVKFDLVEAMDQEEVVSVEEE